MQEKQIKVIRNDIQKLMRRGNNQYVIRTIEVCKNKANNLDTIVKNKVKLEAQVIDKLKKKTMDS